ncbi:SufS family cysteine desulfurase [Roseibium aggregatum]|uniref:SufS family cysteine desulfurase n=1 Tax=Roseibium aggregatum TaxID=187304 RepID=UPI003A97B601
MPDNTITAKTAAPVPIFDVEAIRAEFPILSREVHGKPLVYLDNAASAQKPKAVLEAMAGGYAETYSNVHRGIHFLSSESTAAFEKAREAARRFVNAGRIEEIVFTKGGTEAINLVASGLGADIQPGDEIIVTDMEHHSNIVPWHFLRERKGAVLKWVPVTEDGDFDLEAFSRLLSPRTRIVSVTHMSNVLGTISPLQDVIRLAHAAGATVLVDGCQGSVHETVDVQALGCDFYAATGHKLYGPSGIGFLYGKYEHLERLQPYQGGGEMIETVTRENVTYGAPPHRFEAGTPPIVPAIGLGAALAFMESMDRRAAHAHEAALLAHATEELSRIDGLGIFGTAPGKGALVTFELEGFHAHDVSMLLDRSGIAVRSGSHCAQPLMDHLGVTSTTRASFAVYNTHEDVEALVAGIRKVKEFFG